MYPGVLAVSMRKYVYAVLLLAHAVPLPPTSDVEHEYGACARRRVARRVDLEDLHELRLTQATLLQGVVSPKAAQHRLGHSQISMTMNTYAHFLDAEDIAVAEAMDDILKPKAK